MRNHNQYMRVEETVACIAHDWMLDADTITMCVGNNKYPMHNVRVTAACKIPSHIQLTVSYWLNKVNWSIFSIWFSFIVRHSFSLRKTEIDCRGDILFFFFFFFLPPQRAYSNCNKRTKSLARIQPRYSCPLSNRGSICKRRWHYGQSSLWKGHMLHKYHSVQVSVSCTSPSKDVICKGRQHYSQFSIWKGYMFH